MDRLARATVAVISACAAGPFLLAGCIHLATRDRVLRADQVPAAEVALVLGAEVYPGGRPSGFLRARLDVAADLHRRGLVSKLLLSGDGRSRFYDEPAAMRDYLVGEGIPEAALILDREGLDTYASCARARDVFGLTRLTVVSQRYHLPRALAICGLLGIDARGVGDTSAKSSSQRWDYGVRREVAANLKLLWDVVTQRPWVRR